MRKDDDEEEGQSLHAKLLRYRYVRKIEARGVGDRVFAVENFLKMLKALFETGNCLFYFGGGACGLISGAPGHLRNS